MENLDEFLKGSDEQPTQIDERRDNLVEAVNQEGLTQETAETPETAEQPETVERPRGPDGKFISKGEKETAEPPSTEEPKLDHAALLGERRRRQEAEDRIRALEEQMARIQTPPAEQPQAPPDRWEDPEGYDQWLVDRAAQAAEQRAVQAVQQQRIYQSAVRARGKYEDYDQAHQVFGEMAQRNPALFDQMLAQDDPAEFAYREAKAELEIRNHGSIEALVAARVKAELEKVPAAPPPIPGTLADAQSSRSASAESIPQPKALDEIVGSRFL